MKAKLKWIASIAGVLFLVAGCMVYIGLPSIWALNLCSKHLPGNTQASLEIPYTAEADWFTLAVIPDTQHYCRNDDRKWFEWPKVENPYFDLATQWIINNKDRLNLSFVTHTGDVVDERHRYQWNVAAPLLERFLDAGVPIGISVGNHDMRQKTGDSSLFNQYFPSDKFTQFGWYGAGYISGGLAGENAKGNSNSFQLITTSGIELIFIHLECNAPDSVLAWADEALKLHASRLAIVVTHMWLGAVEKPPKATEHFTAPTGIMNWGKCHGANGNPSAEMWEKLVSRHPNVLMVLSGDQSEFHTLRIISKGMHGNAVTQMMFDHGKGRLIRLLRFKPALRTIDVITWDIISGKPFLGSERRSSPSDWQFSIPFDVPRPE